MNLDALADAYHQQLVESDEATDYFNRWGVHPRMATHFKLGWVTEPLVDPHKGVAGFPVFPYRAVGGSVTALRFNAYEFDHLRQHTHGILGRNYPLQVPEYHLYNVGHALPGMRTNVVWLTEEVYTVHQLRMRGERAVAAPGYRAFHDPWAHLFEEAKTMLVTNEYHEDDAAPVYALLRRKGVEVHKVTLADDRQLGEMLASGALDVQDVLARAGQVGPVS